MRFKKSAAIAATKDIIQCGTKPRNNGLIQIVLINFDVNISFQNCKITTHSLAMCIAQPVKAFNMEYYETVEHDTILRISKPDMKQWHEYNIRYQGPKVVSMPEQFSNKGVLPLKVLSSTIISERRAKELDLAFLTYIINTESCAEYNCYITRESFQMKVHRCNEIQRQSICHQTQRLTKERGQRNTIFTSDQQLYKVAVGVKWTYPQELPEVILHLGEMHMMISFISAIETRMGGTGVSKLLESAFTGVPKMLSRKEFPQNVKQ